MTAAAGNGRKIGPDEALACMNEHGYRYLDVRTEQEFRAGHPAQAYNVPISLRGASGMTPNADFLAVVQAVFAKDAKLVVGCKAGSRSLAAVRALIAAGYTELLDQTGGYDGARDSFGRVTTPGWKAAGLPTATEPESGHDYAALAALVDGEGTRPLRPPE